MLHALIKDGALGLPRIHRELLVKGTWVDGDSLPDREAQREFKSVDADASASCEADLRHAS